MILFTVACLMSRCLNSRFVSEVDKHMTKELRKVTKKNVSENSGHFEGE
jgi:hypothetical protein